MADNRIFLLHEPSGVALCLGKRYFGSGWTTTLKTTDLSRFFKWLNENQDLGAEDDLIIAMESQGGADIKVFTDWVYTFKDHPEGFTILEYKGLTLEK